jgi:hypothetical protein
MIVSVATPTATPAHVSAVRMVWRRKLAAA